jgi:hypothetical protein
VFSLTEVYVTVQLPRDLELLQKLSKKAKNIYADIEEGYEQETSIEF